MSHFLRLILVTLSTIIASPIGLAQVDKDIVIKMSECEAKRKFSLYVNAGLFVKSSRELVSKGSIKVGTESFDIYLPEAEGAYSVAPRPKRKTQMIKYTSTYLAVDQNHDGKISSWESYLAGFPLRIGDSMFEVKSIASDGSSITLRPSNGPLRGAVIGRKAPEFEFKTIDGKTLNRDSYKGRALLIDCWAPS